MMPGQSGGCLDVPHIHVKLEAPGKPLACCDEPHYHLQLDLRNPDLLYREIVMEQSDFARIKQVSAERHKAFSEILARFLCDALETGVFVELLLH